MKMLKKLAALVLAATMVLVLFTACGGDGGSTGTREPEKEKVAFDAIVGDNRVAATAKVNDPQLQAVAEKHLNEDLQAQIDFFGAKFFGKVLWQSSRGRQRGRVSDHYRDDKIRLRVFLDENPEGS